MRNRTGSFRVAAAAAVVGLLSFSGLGMAHQQWLAPNFDVRSGDSAWLSFDHTFGDQRFHAGSGPGSYYSWWIVGPDGLRRSIPHLFLGRTKTVGEIELTEPGTYRIEAVEDLMPWTQIMVDGEERWQPGTRDDFDGFEILRSRVYFNRTVSYVTLESMTELNPAGAGDPLEILFDSHPNDLRVGAGVRARVLAFGQPLPEQEVRLFAESSEGHDASATCSTDADGYCEFEDLSAGRYLLATDTQGDSPEEASVDGFSYGFSVVFDVKSAVVSAETGNN